MRRAHGPPGRASPPSPPNDCPAEGEEESAGCPAGVPPEHAPNPQVEALCRGGASYDHGETVRHDECDQAELKNDAEQFHGVSLHTRPYSVMEPINDMHLDHRNVCTMHSTYIPMIEGTLFL